MRLKQLLWLLPLLLCVALPAKADQEYVWVNGSYASINNGFAIGPYGGTLNGTPTNFYCVDFNDQISGNTGWKANVTSLISSSGYGNTHQGSSPSAQTFYLEMAWLVTQMMNPKNSKALDAQLQWAIWYLSLGKTDKSFTDYKTDLSWDLKALSAVNGGFKVTGWEILTPAGSYGQEFIVPDIGAATPEPSTIVLLFAGLAAFLALAHKK
jgi:hypothetical protein